ncbi:MAG TPA: hypothetical protein VHX68_21340 [Planctomycetaceae bacterium]|jgi:hypothetical protein|nr:hypothetical protein [Planctomycetaceae bacterium]
MAKRKQKHQAAAAVDPVEIDRATDDGMPESTQTPGEFVEGVLDVFRPGLEPAACSAYRTIDLVIPLADEAPGYQPMIVELRLKKDEAVIVRRLLEGLAAANQKLTNGQPPKRYEDGLRILINMIGGQAALLTHTSPHDPFTEFQGD